MVIRLDGTYREPLNDHHQLEGSQAETLHSIREWSPESAVEQQEKLDVKTSVLSITSPGMPIFRRLPRDSPLKGVQAVSS